MQRRVFCATAAALLAGCGQAETPTERPAGDDEKRPTAEPTDEASTESATRTRTPTPSPASISVTDLSMPSTIEIGTRGILSVTVENAGGQSGSFESAVERKVGTGEWAVTEETIEVTVGPGETVTESVDLPPYDYLEPVSYRLTAADPVARSRFVPRTLSLGDGHRLPNGVVLSVESVAFADEYTYQGEDGETTLQPTDGEQWAIGTMRAENTVDETARAPLVSDIAFFRDDQEFAYQHIGDNADRYRGGDLGAGAVSEGDLPSDVPREADRSDLRIEYSEELAGGRVTVRWPLAE